MILIDTREQDLHIYDALLKLGVPCKREKLDYMDYHLEGTNLYIERKKTIDEVYGNIATKDRERFSREFVRARRKGAEMYMFIEQSHEQLLNREYRAKESPTVIKKMFRVWSLKYSVPIFLLDRSKATEFVLKTFGIGGWDLNDI